jgi:hypothetical protein
MQTTNGNQCVYVCAFAHAHSQTLAYCHTGLWQQENQENLILDVERTYCSGKIYLDAIMQYNHHFHPWGEHFKTKTTP